MLTMYVRRDCLICDHAIHVAYRAKVPFYLKFVGEDVTAEQLLADYPMFECENYIEGISLPIVLDDDTVIGGYNELLVHLAKS